MENSGTLGVIGAGVMGQTLVRGLLASGTVARALIWCGERNGAQCEAAAAALGFQAVTVGKLDTINPDGTVTAGVAASVTLKNNGGTIQGNQPNTSSASGS